MARILKAMALLVSISFLSGADKPAASSAKEIIERYLAMPFPDPDPKFEASIERHKTLRRLVGEPGAVGAIAETLKKSQNARQRAELVDVLREFRSAEAAEVLVQALSDSDDKVRANAIQGLRVLAARVQRMGTRFHGEPSEPAVPGLVPHLIAALNDSSETNRSFALYALADSRDPAAVAQLASRLNDSSPKVRLDAACLLTEFSNAAGLPELKTTLRRLRNLDPDKLDPDTGAMYYFEADHVLAALERITGKSFGSSPGNPLFSSDSRAVPAAKPQYQRLIENWVAWWDWQPAATTSPQ
jgi:HEAT repeat protein